MLSLSTGIRQGALFRLEWSDVDFDKRNLRLRGITAKSGVSWTTMGREAGEYLARRHPAGSEPVSVAWFPGPQGAGWVEFIEVGFKRGVQNSAVDVVVTKWGDTGKEIQRTLVQEVLESHLLRSH